MSAPQKFPAGWDQARVQAVIDHYDGLSDDELAAEDEAAFDDENMTTVVVPNELMPEIRRLLAAFQKPA